MKSEGEITASHYFWEVRDRTSSHKWIYLLFPVLWLFFPTQDQEILLDHLEPQPLVLSTSYQKPALGQMFVTWVWRAVFSQNHTWKMGVEAGSQSFAGRLLTGLRLSKQRGFKPVSDKDFSFHCSSPLSMQLFFQIGKSASEGRWEVRNREIQGGVLPRGRAEL